MNSNIDKAPNYPGRDPNGLGNFTGDKIPEAKTWICSGCNLSFPGTSIPTKVTINGEVKIFCANCGLTAAVNRGDL